MKKVDFPINKKDWHPSLIPGVIALISTYNLAEEPNIAPKSWIQMVSFDPPIIMFSGTKDNTTEESILKNGYFGVNFVDSTMAKQAFDSIKWYGKERIQQSGFKLTNAKKINAPIIENCKANLECKLYDTKQVGTGFVIFGEIVAASIWEEIMKVDRSNRYKLLDLILYLEDNTYAKITRDYLIK